MKRSQRLWYRFIHWLTVSALLLSAKPAAAGLLFNSTLQNSGLGLGTATPISITVTIIVTMLQLLGLIAFVFILYAGFMWMTAAGNTERVEKAQGIMKAAVIGLMIILASYGIGAFIFQLGLNATGSSQATPSIGSGAIWDTDPSE